MQIQMQIFVNDQAHELPEGATLSDALAVVQARLPFAAAVNLQFVPRTAHAEYVLKAGDRVEIIAPLTGG